MAEQSLKNKTIKGTAWSAADAFLGQGVTFLVGIVLARLLSPDEYGLIGICLIFNTVLNGIVDSGFSTALIRKKEATNEDYDTMFITNFVMSILLYLLLFISSPFISVFFHREELTLIIRIMGLILIINALSITQLTILTKKIDFKTRTKVSLISSVSSGAIGILMAYLGYGVWALVAQQISKQSLYTICLWIFNKWCPTFRFYTNSFKYMWGFGWKMLLSGLLNNIWEQLYQVIVGKFYNPSTLGQYTRAREYANIFSQNLTVIVQRVSFPVLSDIQEDTTRMVAAYRKIIKTSMFITTMCLIPLGAISEPLIYFLIGEQWTEAVYYLPLICISMTLYPLHAINLNMLKVLGRSDIFLYIEIAKKIVSILPICLGIFVSIRAMLIGTIVTGIIAFFLNSFYTGKKLAYSSWKQISDVIKFYAIGSVIAISVYFIKFLNIPNLIILFIQLIIGIALCIIICELFKIQEYIEIKNIIKKAYSQITK